jgi:hypothetical protein
MDSNLAEQREETRWGTEQDVYGWRSLELVALEGSSALCSHAKVTESHSYRLLEAAMGRGASGQDRKGPRGCRSGTARGRKAGGAPAR